MQIKELIKKGIINTLKVTKKTYNVRGLICKDKKDIFLKVSEKTY